jgi:MFS transporter, OFA family, oxalate/formate antiporter
VFGSDPFMFVILTGLVFFAWGEIYSLFPATCGDTFGSKYAASNAGLLYTAKGTAAFLVPFASLLSSAYGWSAVFTLIIVLNVTAAALAMFLLRPMRARYLAAAEPAATLAPQPIRAA